MIISTLIVIGKAVRILSIVINTILIWKTVEYFSKLPERDENKPLLAWDTISLSLTLVYLIVTALIH